MIEHRGRGDQLGAQAKLLERLAGGVIPELLEDGDAVLARHLARPLRRIDAERAQALLCEHLEQRAVVAADVDHQIVGPEPELVDDVRGELFEMRDHRRVDPGEVRVIAKQHVLRREFRDLHFPAVLADHHRERKRQFARELAGFQEVVAVGWSPRSMNSTRRRPRQTMHSARFIPAPNPSKSG